MYFMTVNKGKVVVVGNHHELGEYRPSKECIACHFEIGYLKLHVLSLKFFSGLEGHMKNDLVDRGRSYSGDYSVEGAQLGRNVDLGSPIYSKVFKNKMYREFPPSMSTQLSFTSFMIGLTIRG
jgi:hypothetical protein